ncbi:MAG: hypothetical protein F6K03_07435 [Kamptonema sp. SIO4C4]|nr:hypothetical protein [Kamptonema sp. SIO4C4]
MSASTLSRYCLTVAGSVAIAWGIAIAPASACSPMPGSQPTPLSERVANTQYVFAGTVTNIEDNTVTIRVNEYIQGQGPRQVQVSGFNSHSCSDFIQETGQEYLFFAEETGNRTWSAVYDGAFGSIEPWNAETQAQLAQTANNSQTELPQEIADSIKQEIATRFNLDSSRVDIINAERQTWPDGCLGLSFPQQACTLAIVEGWSVQAQARQKVFNYRTDSTGNRIYLENGAEVLPNRVRNGVLREIDRQFSVRRRQLEVTAAYPRTWDGCYGLAKPNQACLSIAIFGWQVVVAGNDQQWVYHTDGGGSEVHFNEELSDISGESPVNPSPLRPLPIPEEEMPSRLPEDLVFRVTASGGIAGMTRK